MTKSAALKMSVKYPGMPIPKILIPASTTKDHLAHMHRDVLSDLGTTRRVDSHVQAHKLDRGHGMT